jgi:hypothetical protein
MNKTTLLIISCALLVIPSLAQNLQGPNNCSLAGTWYGGSDYKYISTITPVTGQTFAITSDPVFDNASFGYKAWTSWSGELVKITARRYVAQVIGMFTTSAELPPPVNSYELDGARAWVEFIDCDHLQFSYDFFSAYFDLSKIPFVDPPDLNYLPPGGIVETYQRMPTTCPACSLPAAPTRQLRPRR